MLAELGLPPLLQHVWLLQAARFWNVLAADMGLHHLVALDAIRLAVEQRVQNWVSGLVGALRGLGYIMQLTVGEMHPIDDLRFALPPS